MTVDLAGFLLQRIEEDEAQIRDGTAGIIALSLAARVLAECEAKRAIVAWCGEHERIRIRNFGMVGAARERDFVPGELAHPADSVVLRLLALPYASHPDYREEWKP